MSLPELFGQDAGAHGRGCKMNLPFFPHNFADMLAALEYAMNIRKTFLVIAACAAAALAVNDAKAARPAAQQRLYEKAVKVCSAPEYPYGTRPYINYAGGWFRCVEPELVGKHDHKRER
jgi:hypothetical protein